MQKLSLYPFIPLVLQYVPSISISLCSREEHPQRPHMTHVLRSTRLLLLCVPSHPFPSSSVLELNLRKCKCITICCLSLSGFPKNSLWAPSTHPLATTTTGGGNYSMHIEHGQTFIWLCMYFALQCDTELTKTINRRNATNNQDPERDAPISSSR